MEPDARIGPWYAPEWSRRPPGMTWEDWQPWQVFAAAQGKLWTHWAYNVRLYKGDPEPPIADPELDRQWRESTAMRIDAVGFRAGKYTIFEARRVSGWSAVGQLMGYQALWQLHYPDLDLEAMYLVTEKADAAMHATAALKGLIVVVTK